jgi:hypothetical protein
VSDLTFIGFCIVAVIAAALWVWADLTMSGLTERRISELEQKVRELEGGAS